MKESRRITPLRTILRNCLNHIENLEGNPSDCDNYDKEFQDLKQFSETLKVQKDFACTEGEKEVNRKKNRYKDILPFNISRVVLSEYAGVPGSDYINANFIKGASGSPAYIACQGPLPNTVNDFWRMVVECEVQVIVMACNPQESGKHKCENYWVEKEGEEKRFGMVQISLVKASIVCPDFLVRTMRLRYINDKDITEERTVCQFHYSAWPDHGVPPLVRPLLDMVRLVRDTQASETLPVLVHCSAGCGRTGTICAIDFVWGLLRAGKLTEEFSLFNLVRDMRKQRVAMVQTKEQYILVHQAVRELFKEQLQVIESHPYENIDFNGVPLIKDFEEPFYDTIGVQKEENCDEKQDMSEVKEKEDGKINKTDTAPPLPRKKRPNVLFSKQEKEAENLTEKNRLSCTEKEKEKADATFSGLLTKPRIVKLRALFEKNLNAKERATLKDRGSQTVSRSQSLGAIRKPVTSELFDPQCTTEKAKPSALFPHPTESIKLKHSKSFSRAVPLIKRSKSLKTFGQSPLVIMSPSTYPERKAIKSYPSKSEGTEYVALNGEETNMKKPPTAGLVDRICREGDYGILGVGNLKKENSIRRRSLESLMGDAPPAITWPITVMATGRNEKHFNSHSNRSPDFIGQQLKRINLESDKNLGTIASSIGTRERRNSFRQAVDKSDLENIVFGTGQQPFGSKTFLGSDYVYINSIRNFNDKHSEKKSEQKLTVKNASSNTRLTVSSGKPVTQDRMTIETSHFQFKNSGSRQSIRRNSMQDPEGSANHHMMDARTRTVVTGPAGNRSRDELDLNFMSKNLFLKKLNSEIIYERGNKAKHMEQRFREPFDVPGSFMVPQMLHLDMKKGQPINRIQDVDEPDGPKVCLIRPPKIENIDRVVPLWPDSQTKVSKCQGQHSNSNQGRTSPSHKEIRSYQTVVGESSSGDLKRSEGGANKKFSFALSHQRKNICFVAPAMKLTEPEALPYGSYRRVVDLTNNSDGVEKKLPSPTKSLLVDKNHKTSFDCLLWPPQAGSSRSSGEGSSSDQLSTKSDSLRLVALSEGEPSSKFDVRTLSKGDQVKRMGRVRPTNSPQSPGYGNVANQRKEDHVTTFKVHQNPSRYSKDDFLLTEPTAPPRVKRHASVTIPRTNLSTSDLGSSQENKMIQSNQSDKNTWEESFGIDLDAIAASMHQGDPSVLRNAIKTGKNYVSGPASTGSKKKQHYF